VASCSPNEERERLEAFADPQGLMYSRGCLRTGLLLLWVLLLAHDGGPKAPAASTPPPAQETELQAALENVEYQPTEQAGVLSAPNRAHGLRLEFTEAGLTVKEREGGAPLVAFGLNAFGRADSQRALGGVAVQASVAGRVERHFEGIVEWFLNQREGVEHGWTVTAKAEGEGPLVLSVAVSGARALVSGAEALFESETGRVLRYGHLKAVDAVGTELLARMSSTGDGLRIEVDDTEAHYPIVIDPLLTASAWTAESNQANARFGVSLASAGDVNGDGYSDVVVGAYTFDNGESGEGRAFLYLGTASGLASTPVWTAESNQVGATFGTSVASAGDVNGDGYSDVVVGAYAFDNGEADEGRAFLFLGSASGLASTPAWTAESNQVGATFGTSVASAGDVNGDGYSDVVVAASSFDNGESDEGRVFLYLGSASGLASTPVWTAESNQVGARFGTSVASAGDVNGDGYSDVVVGARSFDNGESDEGGAFLFVGSTSGLTPTPAWTAEGDQNSASFGFRVASAGDVNGDGYSDVVVGAPGFGNGESFEGRTVLYLGSASGLGPTPAWAAESNQTSAGFGAGVASAGDVNGDGFSDVVVGATGFDNDEVSEGRAFLYLGGASGLAPTPAWTAESDQSLSSFGDTVACAGDVNGDGLSDVVVGAYDFDNGESNEGRAFLYVGSASGLSLTAAWTTESNQAGALLGSSVASAGDVNGDGSSDVVVGAESFTNGESIEGRAYLHLGSASGLGAAPAWTAESNQLSANFGFSVASAGDVNGDGYSDVVVGSYEASNGEAYEGRAFLFQGSPTGLTSSPAWTGESDQAGGYFGRSVASAGDVNGDGYSDVVVGASWFDNGEVDEGRASLYLGGASGLSPAPAWTVESNQANSWFGESVASAGDVNGDGYSDVVVGASFFDNGEVDEGNASLYLGSASGLSPTPAWTAEGNQAGAQFGISVATAGDVNRDGYSDVVVGASFFDNGQTNEGRAFLFLGGASGLSLVPAWTAESNQASALFGKSVAGAGDVNGDGYFDVVVGAPRFSFFPGLSAEGRVYVYLGSSSGLALAPTWTASGNALGFFDAHLGESVASAGDINNDGFADIVIGAPKFASSESNEGRAFVFLGGDGAPGLPRGMTQQLGGAMPAGAVTRGSAPVRISALGFNGLATQGLVALETEVKPLGVPFDGTAVVRSAPGLARQRQTATWPTLAPNRYHWRARLVSGQERGRWLSYGGNSEAEADFVIATTSADAGTVDAGIVDAGIVDAGIVDAGIVDAGIVDAGIVDAGIGDAGIVDAGIVDAGDTDAGIVDPGTADAGAVNAGSDDRDSVGGGSYAVGCGCNAPSGSAAPFVVLLVCRASRRFRVRHRLSAETLGRARTLS
jgi:hypothetical protein